MSQYTTQYVKARSERNARKKAKKTYYGQRYRIYGVTKVHERTSGINDYAIHLKRRKRKK